jgi:hypothetical protein
MRCETCEAFFAGMGQRCPIMADLTKRARETRRAAIARAESLPPAPELDPGDRT